MELRELRYFWTVAEEKNFSRAAKVLHITQPTLSRQIKEFEEKLGVPLFIRKKKQLSLTDEGYFLKERATQILTLAAQTEREFEEQSKGFLSGHFSIGCVEADNSDTMAMMLEELVREYPKVTFNIVSGTSDDISDKLEKGILDLAILLEPLNAPDFEKIILPRAEKWGLLVSNASSIAQKTAIYPDDLEGIPLLISNRSEVQSMLEIWRNKPLTTLKIVGTFNLIFNVFSLVENRTGSALTIEGATTNIQQGKLTFIPLAPRLKTNCVLVFKKKRIQTPLVREVIKRFNDAFKA
ncbi:LysR family transcriptional regulator [Brochothrix thermosphacta]|uniref:LysR family transcriptional regulator n=1 Tax=Brochothrix thermosphacta TaxID=2756 RepID=UPI00083F9F56|nr:LysR family transcriptional regulator [Brochothrix thermosphacta]ODJ62784.1 transcriptional regulator [Brochothrix thermosphacta]